MKGLTSTLVTAMAFGLLAGAAVGVAAQEAEVAPPVGVTGKIAFGPCPRDEEVETAPGVVQSRGDHYCNPVVVEPFSDPRLQGETFVWTWNDAWEGGLTIWTIGFTITNDDGAWRGIPIVTLDGGGTYVLVGDGAYEGLTMVADVTLDGEVWDWQGSIIEGEVPPMPAPPAEAD